MGAHLVTGYAGSNHITAADQGQYNAGTVGSGKYVLNTGNKFAYEIISNNLIKIKDGDLINQGRHINIAPNDYEECTIDNGLQSVKRNDLIVMRYFKNADTLVETAQVVVIKGVSGDNAVDPTYISGDILNGAETDDFPLYRVKLDGLNITAVEQLFTTIPTIQDINTDLNGSKSANTVLVAPNGSSGSPSFRRLVAADLPYSYSSLNLTKGSAATSIGVCNIMVAGRVVTLSISTVQIASLGTIITGVPYRPRYGVYFPLLYSGSTTTAENVVHCTLTEDGTVNVDRGEPGNGWFRGTVTYVYDSVSN